MNRVIRLIGITMGGLGVVLCAAALLGVWVAYPNWVRTTDEVYFEVDKDLEIVQDRIEIARERVRSASELTAMFRANLKEWATAESQAPKHAGQRAELISTRLHQVRDGLTFAEAFLKRIQSAQKLAHPFKAPEDNTPIDGLREQLAVLKEHVSRVVDSVDGIFREFRESGNEAELEHTIEHATAELVHILDVIESLNDRIGRLSSRVSEARTQTEELEVDLKHWMWWGRLGSTILLPWMAVGQMALVVLCWRRRLADHS